MRTTFLRSTTVAQTARWAPAVIVLGLAMLLVGSFWPVVPVVTAMALMALGATGVTLARFRGTPALLPVILLHLAVYGGLYALFIGATLHAANARSGARLEGLTILDVVVSVAPMLVAGRMVWDAFQTDGACDA